MAVLLDSAMIIAFLHRRDHNHAQAQQIVPALLNGERGVPAVTDDIVDEVLTFLVARGATRQQLDQAIAFLLGDGDSPGPLSFHPVGPDHFAEALRLVRRHRERRLSFTDCTSLAVMGAAGIPLIATFDAGFRGLAETLPA